VPLSPKAIEALRELARLNLPEPEAPIVQMSYESLKAAWKRACERAGITDLRIHDLRHTAATRMALRSGNIFLVKALTGHKTLSQLERYVNVKASDVVALLHASEASKAAAESKDDGHSNFALTAPQEQTARCVEVAASNVVQVNFGQRRVA